MGSTTVTRVDSEIVESARVAGELMSRNTSQQVTHWARIGREIEAAESMSPKAISEVLAGAAHYDHLSSGGQAVVRALWSEALDARIADVNFQSRFMAEGRAYAELDEAGNVVVHNPARS
jgi:ParD-like antitoxin of type II bacterial toxin-antitoxin system